MLLLVIFSMLSQLVHFLLRAQHQNLYKIFLVKPYLSVVPRAERLLDTLTVPLCLFTTLQRYSVMISLDPI